MEDMCITFKSGILPIRTRRSKLLRANIKYKEFKLYNKIYKNVVTVLTSVVYS